MDIETSPLFKVVATKNLVRNLLLALIFVAVSALGLRLIGQVFGNPTLGNVIINAFINQVRAAEGDLEATLIGQSNSVINVAPEKGYTFSVKFRNSGTDPWRNVSLKTASDPSQFKHNFWPAGNTAQAASGQLDPGQEITMRFAVQGPSALGLYSEKFYLEDASGEYILNSLIEVPINVTLNPAASAPVRPQPTSITNHPSQTTLETNNSGVVAGDSDVVTENSGAEPESVEVEAKILTVGDLELLLAEPTLRVGLYYPDDKKLTVTADSLFELYTEDGVKQGTYGAGTQVKISYIGGSYNVTLPSGTASFSQPLTLRPVNGAIMEIASLEWRTVWNPSINDNRYRGDIELKYNPRTDRFWVINILPLEQYIAGLSETSNIEVPEFHKAISLAARSYALWHYLDNSKHGGFFHVDATYDQVYRGYNAERRLPEYVAGAQATAGQAVTYEDEIALATYFTQSDGQTKNYKDVWGGYLDVPYLTSVPVPQDVGRSLIGHGVGMSAQGAQRMAYLDNEEYLYILDHFYPGTSVNRVYPSP